MAENLTEQAAQAAKELGIDVMTSDIFQPKTFVGKSLQATGERVFGVGTGSKRATQQEQRVAAIENVAQQFNANSPILNTERAVMEDLARKRGDDIIKYSKMKNDVFVKMDQLPVKVDETISTLDNELSRLKSLKTKGVAPLVNTLQDYKKAIANQNIGNIETLRRQLGDQLKSPDMASASTEAEKVSRTIYRALNNDIGNFVKENGDRRDYTKWAVANKQISLMNNEIENDALRATLRKGNVTPEVVTRMLYSKKPSELNLLYKNLTPDGRSNARAAILGKAYQDAIGKEGEVSTAKFMTNLNKMQQNFDVFFKGDNKEVLGGLKKALDLTKQAENANILTKTGMQLYIPATVTAFTGLFGSGGAGLAGIASIGLIARIYESTAMRNILMKLNRAKTAKEKSHYMKMFSELIKKEKK